MILLMNDIVDEWYCWGMILLKNYIVDVWYC